MWVTIISICCVQTYTTVYSLTLFLGTESDKCYILENRWINSISTCIERNLHYIIWVYPVIWLFWPAEAFCHCRKKRESESNIGRSSMLTASNNSQLHSTVNWSKGSEGLSENEGSDDELHGRQRGKVKTFLKNYEPDSGVKDSMQFVVRTSHPDLHHTNEHPHSQPLITTSDDEDSNSYQRHTFRAS